MQQWEQQQMGGQRATGGRRGESQGPWTDEAQESSPRHEILWILEKSGGFSHSRPIFHFVQESRSANEFAVVRRALDEYDVFFEARGLDAHG